MTKAISDKIRTIVEETVCYIEESNWNDVENNIYRLKAILDCASGYKT